MAPVIGGLRGLEPDADTLYALAIHPTHQLVDPRRM